MENAPNTQDSSGILADIFGAAGYSTAFAIDADELAFLREAIFKQWIDRIETVHPEHAPAFRAGGIEQYHQLSQLISHETLWPKEFRVLPHDAATQLTQFAFMRRLSREFGGACRMANVTLFSKIIPDYPDVYWRLVRPGVVTDVGSLHTDKWFHEVIGNGTSLWGEDETTVKMWLAIFTEPNLNGLHIIPGSHRKSWRIKYTTGPDGFRRPSLDEPLGDYAKQLVPLKPGQAVLFNDELLHGGAVNGGSTCRVNIEITFILKRSAITR